MKKFIFFLINIFSVLGFLYSEPIIGLVDQSTGRGISNADDRYLKIEASSNFYPYAQGNLLSNRIDSIETNYYEKEFGNALSNRVDIIETGVVYKTDSDYTNIQYLATNSVQKDDEDYTNALYQANEAYNWGDHFGLYHPTNQLIFGGTTYTITNIPNEGDVLCFNALTGYAWFDVGVSYGITDTNAYRGDWGHSVSGMAVTAVQPTGSYTYAAGTTQTFDNVALGDETRDTWPIGFETNVISYTYDLAGHVVAIDGGSDFSIALVDGEVITWGGGTPVPEAASNGVTAIAAYNQHALALKDGCVIAWGLNDEGQCDVPEAASNGVTAIACGRQFSLALKNGEVIAWGLNDEGQCDVPEAAKSGVSAVAAGFLHSLALKGGAVIGWGKYSTGNPFQPPPSVSSNVSMIAAGNNYGVALKNGAVIVWADGASNPDGIRNVPETATSGVTAIASGYYHALVIRDGAVIGWGRNTFGQLNCPIPPPGEPIITGIDLHDYPIINTENLVEKTDPDYTNTQFYAETAYNLSTKIHGALESSTNLIPDASQYKVCDIQLDTDTVLQIPINAPTDGHKLQLRIRAIGDDREVTFGGGIKIPASSTVSSPITIPVDTVSILLLDNYLTTTNWFLSSYIQGYEVGE